MAMHPQTAAAMGELLHRLAGNPKTRAQTLKLVKEVDPNYRLPADVAIDDLKAQIAAKDEADKRQAETNRAQNRRAGQRKKLLDSGDYDEKALKEIEETVMKKYPALDYDDAVKLYRAEAGPARPSHVRPEQFKQGQIWQFPDIPGLLQNPEKAAQDAAYSIIDEFRGR
jgi:hypothetical protein